MPEKIKPRGLKLPEHVFNKADEMCGATYLSFPKLIHMLIDSAYVTWKDDGALPIPCRVVPVAEYNEWKQRHLREAAENYLKSAESLHKIKQKKAGEQKAG